MSDAKRAPWVLRWSMPLLLVGMAGVFTYDRFTTRPAREAALAYVEHVRAGRDPAAEALTTAEFRNDLLRGATHHKGPTASDTPDAVLGGVRRSRSITETTHASGVGLRCFQMDLDAPGGPDRLYIELVEDGGAWKVDGLAGYRAFGLCD